MKALQARIQGNDQNMPWVDMSVIDEGQKSLKEALLSDIGQVKVAAPSGVRCTNRSNWLFGSLRYATA